MMGLKNKTFHWKEVVMEDGLVLLKCFHTQQNDVGMRRKVMCGRFALPEEVAACKASFEEARKCVVEGGAWEPKENAMWSFMDGEWFMSESQIKAIV